jgi:hypothetical protein
MPKNRWRLKPFSPLPPNTAQTRFLADGASSTTDQKKPVLRVFAEGEIQGIAVCPVAGIPGKVAVKKIYPYWY